MNKSTLLNNKILTKSNIALFCIVAMVVGFLVSPAVLSIAMFLFGVNGLRGAKPKQWLNDRWWLLGLAWIAFYALSYFWSADKAQWSVSLQVKLPFFLLPLAFAYTPGFTVRQKTIMTVVSGLLILSGALYSLSYLIRDPATYFFGYRVSHLLPTPSRNDHICFSLAVTLYLIWCVYFWPLLSAALRWLMGVIMLMLTLYIHILAAKTGIISLYLFFAGWALYLAFSKRWLVGMLVLVAIPSLVFFSLRYVATFRDRESYMAYSLYMLEHGDRSGHYGDIGRIWSYTISLKIIGQHPWLGVGSGDMLTEMKKGYDKWHPEVEDQNRLVPHNQFLIVGMCAGIPAMLIFAVWIFYPLTWLKRNRQSFFFFMVWLELMFYILIDTGLEVQMGVFVFLFFLLLQKKELTEISQKQSTSQSL